MLWHMNICQGVKISSEFLYSSTSTWKTMLWHMNVCQGVKIWVLGGGVSIYIYIYNINIYIYIYIHLKYKVMKHIMFVFSDSSVWNATVSNRPSRAAKYALFSERVAAELPEVGMGWSADKSLVTNQMEIPSRELTYPTLGKGKSSSKCHVRGIC